jgi:hypothetical protein
MMAEEIPTAVDTLSRALARERVQSARHIYERLEGRVPAAAARVISLTGDTADAETERFLRHAGRRS